MDNRQNNMVVVYTTFPTREEAQKTGHQLVKEQLAVCVNIWPDVISIYKWENALREETECGVMIKSRADKIDTLMQRLKSLHPYDVPVIFTLEPALVDGDYKKWLDSEL